MFTTPSLTLEVDVGTRLGVGGTGWKVADQCIVGVRATCGDYGSGNVDGCPCRDVDETESGRYMVDGG